MFEIAVIAFAVYLFCSYKIITHEDSQRRELRDAANPPDSGERRLRRWWHPD